MTISTRQVVHMGSCLQWACSTSMAAMANKKTLTVTLMGHAKRYKAHLQCKQVHVFTDLDLLCLRIAQMPRWQDLERL